jgi:predicted ribosome quality control (RQC) complex YloA/Tae2 family protein
MHYNYHFLKQLTQTLARTWGVEWRWGAEGRQVLFFPAKTSAYQLMTAFSQDKDELILGFANETEQLYSKATLKSDFTCLTFFEDFARAKRNSVDLFSEVYHHNITHITQYMYERSFSIGFEGGFELLFKMHNRFANVILFKQQSEKFEFSIAFHKKLENDKNITLDSLDKDIDFSLQGLEKAGGDALKFLPTLGKEARQYLDDLGWQTLPTEQRWELLKNTIETMESGKFYILNPTGLPTFSLLSPKSTPPSEGENNPQRKEDFIFFKSEQDAPLGQGAFKALQEFYSRYTYSASLHHEKQAVLRNLQKRHKQVQSYLDKTLAHLIEVEDSTTNEENANIIMANLHQIPANVTEVELYDFYKDTMRKIKLKKDITPQKTAEQYYRKAKNQKIEKDTLQRNISRKEEEVKVLEAHIAKITALEDLKSLRKYLKDNHLEQKEEEKQENSLFRKFNYLGWDIWVGKNAKNNDVLTQQYARKDDLWLHAKDVSGSHVVIKAQAGKTFPINVIEKAASLAAFYSKRSHDTLCPVLYTPRKFVRKTRDLAAGQVIVEKEEVMMVVPERF